MNNRGDRLLWWIQEGLGTVQGAVSGELEALQEGLNKRQAAAATRTQLQLLRDTAHAQSKVVTSIAWDDQLCFCLAMAHPLPSFPKLSCTWLWAASGARVSRIFAHSRTVQRSHAGSERQGKVLLASSPVEHYP